MQYDSISYVADHISYEDFVDKYLSNNIPCLLSEVYTRTWKCRQDWVKNNQPDFEHLKSNYGEAMVPVADCNQVAYQSHPKKLMVFKHFLDKWKTAIDNKNEHEFCLYLKDWHFCSQFAEYNAYDVPSLFESDWLNEFWNESNDRKDDYKFVYMGPKGTWTPFHADVFRSYSWSANICGHKQWILYPPGAEQYLRDITGNLPFDLRSPEIKNRGKFPDFEKAPKPLIVEQKQGEIIFVPSCWYHQVINKENTISVNHNWINGWNISKTWHHLKEELKLVKKSIDDCKEMEGWHTQCQIIMAANTGINFEGFLELLNTIAKKRISYFDKHSLHSSDIEVKPNIHVKQSLFDLERIKGILLEFGEHKDTDMNSLQKSGEICLLITNAIHANKSSKK